MPVVRSSLLASGLVALLAAGGCKSHITVTSTPEHARVELAGSFIGTTPLEGFVPPEDLQGDVALRVFKDGFHSESYNIRMPLTSHITATFELKQDRNVAGIHVTSDPAPARVFLGDAFVGTTPLDNYVPPPDLKGQMELKVMLDGYQPESQIIQLPLGAHIRMKVGLRQAN